MNLGLGTPFLCYGPSLDLFTALPLQAIHTCSLPILSLIQQVGGSKLLYCGSPSPTHTCSLPILSLIQPK